MFRVNGLYGHIQRNNLVSLALLVGFVLSFELMCLAFWLPGTLRHNMVDQVMSGQPVTFASQMQAVYVRFQHIAVLSLIPGAVWFLVALILHVKLVQGKTGFEPLTRREDLRLYNIVETTAIGFGLPMPAIGVMDVAERNAFACGFSPKTAVLVVTSGLLQALDDEELEAVIAHEMSHIRNRDTRLMAAVFVLTSIMFTFARAMIWRHAPTKWFILLLVPLLPVAAGMLTDLLAMIAAAVISAVLLTLLVRFAISRAREFVADAEAVSYTKNPHALIAALRKIGGRDQISGVDANVHAMMISGVVAGWFGTHPSIEERVDALRAYAGANHLPEHARRDSRARSATLLVGANATIRAQLGRGIDQTTVAEGNPVGAARALLSELKAPPAGGDFVSRNFSTIVLAIAVVITYGLVFGAQALFGPGLFARGVPKDEIKEPLVCFGLDGAEPYHPGTLRFQAPQRTGRMTDWRNADRLRRQLYYKWEREQELRRVMTECSSTACYGASETRLNDILLGYVRERKRVTRAIDELHGEPGLRYILADYDTPFDQQAVKLIKSQLQAGRFDIPAKGTLAAELRLLTEHPGSAFIPCRGQGFARVAATPRPVRSSTDWATKAADEFWK